MKEKPELPRSLGIRSVQAELSGSLPAGLTSPQGCDPYTHEANGESQEVTVNSTARRIASDDVTSQGSRYPRAEKNNKRYSVYIKFASDHY